MTKIILRRRADRADWDHVPELEECDTSSLSYKHLSARDMRNMNLQGVNMRGSILASTDFTGSDLSGADLRDADMLLTVLTDVNLTGANLKGAKWLSILNHPSILKIQPLGEAHYAIVTFANQNEDLLVIENWSEKTINEWDAMTDEEIMDIHEKLLPFWQRQKEHILSEARRKCAEFRGLTYNN